ncbi:hypothetical protein COO60DRAFT_1643853 [Scenedesmus sp. NREL 46B-D3]|nr:hypothetical protein COO60DRAFT_1643853 [Scenedesmus sp. NREL 46B-D3]
MSLSLNKGFASELGRAFGELVQAMQASALGRVQFKLECGLLDKQCAWTYAMLEHMQLSSGPVVGSHDCIHNMLSLELIMHAAADALGHPAVLGVLEAVAAVMSGHPSLSLYISFATLGGEGGKPQPAAAAMLRHGIWRKPREWKYCEFDGALVKKGLSSDDEWPCDEVLLGECLVKCAPGTRWQLTRPGAEAPVLLRAHFCGKEN